MANDNNYDSKSDEVPLVAGEVRDIRYLVPGITYQYALAQGSY